MSRVRVADKKSSTRKLLVGTPLSIKDIIEVLESHEHEIDTLIERIHTLEQERISDE